MLDIVENLFERSFTWIAFAAVALWTSSSVLKGVTFADSDIYGYFVFHGFLVLSHIFEACAKVVSVVFLSGIGVFCIQFFRRDE
jgi:hypothetical protein